MPAGITDTDEMAYVGQMPWHRLGVKVEGDAMTSAQAIEATGMDWTVELAPVYTDLGGISPVEIPDKFATFRTDTNEILGVVGNKYQPVQNIETFNLFDAVIGTGKVRYDTVGTLNGGKRIWLLAKFEDGLTLDNGEQIDSYMLLTNSHDGGSSLTMRWCDIRVVCQNTFEAALHSKSDTARGLKRFTARHTSGIMLKANEAREILELQSEYRKVLEEEINLIAEREWSSQEMDRLAYTLFNLDPTKTIGEHGGTQKANAATLVELFHSGNGNKGMSAWDAFNAVSEYTSHYKGYGRSVATIGAVDDAVVNARLNNNWFGDGVWMRNKTWEILTADEDAKEQLLVPITA